MNIRRVRRFMSYTKGTPFLGCIRGKGNELNTNRQQAWPVSNPPEELIRKRTSTNWGLSWSGEIVSSLVSWCSSVIGLIRAKHSLFGNRFFIDSRICSQDHCSQSCMQTRTYGPLPNPVHIRIVRLEVEIPTLFLASTDDPLPLSGWRTISR